MASSGSEITRTYTDFRGVDFSNKNINLSRSPDALNVWKNYKNSLGKLIETRPDVELFKDYGNTIFGLFFYRVNTTIHMIIHSGTSLIDRVNGIDTVIKQEGMNPKKSSFFICNDILYILDGINYLKYDGQTLNNVADNPFIPTTYVSCSPAGGGTETVEKVNLLTPLQINTFCADGTSKDYVVVAESIDGNYEPIVKIMENGRWVTKTKDTDYTWISGSNTITFEEAPPKPDTDGKDNVSIQFSYTMDDCVDRIRKCNLVAVFDNRVFFSGNPNYPNTVFYCMVDGETGAVYPNYFAYDDWFSEGLDLTQVKAMIPGNNALWVLKEPSQANTSIFYHTPTVDSTFGKIYPSQHSSITQGCNATGINFNDDIVFFSDRGMEGITGDITTEQAISHRSSLVDSKLLNESNYDNMQLIEYAGYLLVIIDNKVYLADSRSMFTNENHYEYEWYYWELPITISCAIVESSELFLGGYRDVEGVKEYGIYTLTDNSQNRKVDSYWTTPDDDFGYPYYQKITNKKGAIVNMEGNELSIAVKTDNNSFNYLETYENEKGYIVPRIKEKKWKTIQLKYYSNKPFGIYKATLDVFIGSYVKR